MKRLALVFILALCPTIAIAEDTPWSNVEEVACKADEKRYLKLCSEWAKKRGLRQEDHLKTDGSGMVIEIVTRCAQEADGERYCVWQVGAHRLAVLGAGSAKKHPVLIYVAYGKSTYVQVVPSLHEALAYISRQLSQGKPSA